jgi:hypothetical protein
MATRATETIAATGTEATYHAATATTGDKVAAVDGTILHVKNGGGSDTTVTIDTPGTVEGLAIENRAVTVPAGEDRFIALSKVYRNPADGLATAVCNPVTSVTFAVVRA